MPHIKKKSQPIYFKENVQKVDRAAGVIKGVVIIQEFLGADTDAYGDNFDETFLDQLVSAGNSYPLGLKSRFGHPNMCDTTLGSQLGRFKNFSKSTNSDGKKVVIADLYLDEIAKNAPSRGDIYTYTLDMAERNSDQFGNSIVYRPADPHIVVEKDAEGNDVTRYYQRLDSFIASDLVDSPAATENLFKDDESLDLGQQVTQFLDDHPEVLDLIQKEEGVLEKFFIKYFTHKKGNQQMSKQVATKTVAEAKAAAKAKAKKLKEDIDAALGTTEKSYDATTQGGTTVTISDDNGDGMPSVGDKVTDASGAPVVGTTEMEDGSSIVTDDQGVITSVTPAPADNNAPASANEAQAKEISTLKEKVASYEAKIKELETENADQQKSIDEISANFDKLKENLAKSKGTFVPPVENAPITPPSEAPKSLKERTEARKKELADKKAAAEKAKADKKR